MLFHRKVTVGMTDLLTKSFLIFMKKKQPYPRFDKSRLNDGTKIPNGEDFVTAPRYWEGYLNQRGGKKLLWETEGCNIPELVEVIKAKRINS